MSIECSTFSTLAKPHGCSLCASGNILEERIRSILKTILSLITSALIIDLVTLMISFLFLFLRGR